MAIGREKMKSKTIIMAILTILMLPHLCYSQNTALSSIDSMLLSKDAGLRIWAAQRLSAPNGFDSITAVNRLLEALNTEIKSPLSHSKIFEGMSTITENLKIRYAQSLAALKPISTQMIIPLLDTAKGEYENWLNISLGFSNYKAAHERIREISQSSPNPNVRATAIRSLENIADTTDIPFLEKALKDTSYTYEFINKDTGQPMINDYPVRSEAAGVLFKLGVDTYRRGWDYEVIKK